MKMHFPERNSRGDYTARVDNENGEPVLTVHGATLPEIHERIKFVVAHVPGVHRIEDVRWPAC